MEFQFPRIIHCHYITHFHHFSKYHGLAHPSVYSVRSRNAKADLDSLAQASVPTMSKLHLPLESRFHTRLFYAIKLSQLQASGGQDNQLTN